ncbi:hypothetical protein Pcinc_021321 [Petrolisthes cinctipes]|uniref:Uncharacterized protein n=1 Tax=Petrolisthes cinctipes TaxID=88211 RepID=A0AAE1FHA6_PETCI|nr:hypothetical protein Pcinc_021321 [Petrolisthes cinctipes]
MSEVTSWCFLNSDPLSGGPAPPAPSSGAAAGPGGHWVYMLGCGLHALVSPSVLLSLHLPRTQPTSTTASLSHLYDSWICFAS